MCAEFIAKKEGAEIHVKLYTETPVLLNHKGKTIQRLMKFSLKPQGTTYPTFNARLASWDERTEKLVKIYEKPTWRTPMASQRCIVPITHFIEPIYLGEFAGTAMEFTSPDHPTLYAAGLYDASADYEGYALILHTPSSYILKIGHHRMPVFLSKENAKRWMSDELKTAEEAYDFLLKHRLVPKLTAKESRKLSKNWQRRQNDYEKKLKSEQNFMEHFESGRSGEG